tara:strand:+ start:67534 stop:68268 length:735 start_codon:yes stop_codon:yes gene_type:complete
MSAEFSVLVATAFSVGLIHTLLGPDHYVPFVAMSRTNGWSLKKTFSVTAMCGIGHVAGSILIGAVGLFFGTVLMRLEMLEAIRGETAAWLLIGFGLAYLSWGILAAIRDIPHTHLHSHADGTVHSHLHHHNFEHRHVHQADEITGGGHRTAGSMTPWLLFVIFAFGPCEVLIPLLMYPAAEADVFSVIAVLIAFSFATIGTMLVVVMASVFGLRFVAIPTLHRYSHALAGFAVLVCGICVKIGW